MGLILGGVPPHDLILDEQSVSLYVGGNPPVKVWPTIKEVVQITLGTGYQARDQFRAALADRGLDYQTVTEIPFDIELVGTGSADQMFYYCRSLTSVPEMDTSGVTSMHAMFSECGSLTTVPAMDTSQVTNMGYLFEYCWSLESVPDMDTSQVTSMPAMFSNCESLTTVPALDTSRVTDMSRMFYYCPSLTQVPAMDTSQVTNMRYLFGYCSGLTTVPAMDTSQVTNMAQMFYGCSSLAYVPDMHTSNVTSMGSMLRDCPVLTDGNIRLIGKHPNVGTYLMIDGSGLTREPFYTTDGQPWPTAEVHEVSVSGKSGQNTAHPLVTVTVPAGETWSVRVQGTMQSTFGQYPGGPQIRIGSSTSSRYGNNASVDYSGTITSANSTIALVTPAASWSGSAGFTGTVTIEK